MNNRPLAISFLVSVVAFFLLMALATVLLLRGLISDHVYVAFCLLIFAFSLAISFHHRLSEFTFGGHSVKLEAIQKKADESIECFEERAKAALRRTHILTFRHLLQQARHKLPDRLYFREFEDPRVATFMSLFASIQELDMICDLNSELSDFAHELLVDLSRHSDNRQDDFAEPDEYRTMLDTALEDYRQKYEKDEVEFDGMSYKDRIEGNTRIRTMRTYTTPMPEKRAEYDLRFREYTQVYDIYRMTIADK